MIDLALAADAAYVPHAATTLSSVAQSNRPESIRAHLLHPAGLSARWLEPLREMVQDSGMSLQTHAIARSAIRGLPRMGRIPRVMWYRLMLPRLLPETDRVLYLDCDTLVLDDLGALWKLDLGAHLLGAVANVFPRDLLPHPGRLGLAAGDYVNSGVLLLDLDGWRGAGTAERIAALAREKPAWLAFPDQDALNAVLGAGHLPLHPRWNVQNSFFYYPWAADTVGSEALAAACAQPAILHFEGPAYAKPWHRDSTHPYQRLYLEHRARTPWPAVPLAGKDRRHWLRSRSTPVGMSVEARERHGIGAGPPAAPPTVSVIVPSFNMGRFLRATLDSILSQDHRPLELVVVDGASSDETVDILREYAGEHPELRWVSEPDDGPADAINKGLAMITGDVAAIQSADDVYYPGAIRTAVAGFAAHPDAAVIYGDTELIDADGGHISTSRYLPFSIPRYLCTSTFIPQSSAFFRPDWAQAVGGVRDRYFVFDIDLWLRIMFRAKVVKVAGVLSAYRRHDVQRDKETSAILESWRALLDESPEIRAAPLRVRLAASAGRRIILQNYDPSGAPPRRELWRAILTYPPAVRALYRPRMLLPETGLRRAWARLARSRP